MINKLHKNFIMKFFYYIIMLSCNFFIALFWGMLSIFMYPFERECPEEYYDVYQCPKPSDIELYSFSILSFIVVFALLILSNNFVFKNVKDKWGRTFAFIMFYVLPIINYIINK